MNHVSIAAACDRYYEKLQATDDSLPTQSPRPMTIAEQGHSVYKIAEQGLDAVLFALNECDLDISEDDTNLVYDRLVAALKLVDGARCTI